MRKTVRPDANRGRVAISGRTYLSLLGTRRLGPIFVVQFLGAFNDNALKFAMLFLASFTILDHASHDAGLFATIATGVFMLPYFLFSAISGEIADGMDKAVLVRIVKGLEVIIMAIAMAGFCWQSLPLLLFSLFLMGCHSTLFGPVKYAILPQHLHAKEIVAGTAVVEAGTFLAILGGQIFAGIVSPLGAASGIFGLSLAGFVASLFVPPAPPAVRRKPSGLHVVRSSLSVLRMARSHAELWQAILGISWFFAAGAVLLSLFVPLVSTVLFADSGVATAFLVLFSVSVALGSLAIGRLLRGEASGRHSVAATVLMGVSLIGLGVGAQLYPVGTGSADLFAIITRPAGLLVLLSLVCTAFAGGMFIVPLYAILQTKSVMTRRSQTIAANNIVNAGLTVVLVLGASVLLDGGAGIPAIIIGLGLLTLLFTVTVGRRLSRF